MLIVKEVVSAFLLVGRVRVVEGSVNTKSMSFKNESVSVLGCMNKGCWEADDERKEAVHEDG